VAYVREISGSHGREYVDGACEPIPLAWKLIVLMMEAVSTSETSVNFYQG
jgi:hypothetical protein